MSSGGGGYSVADNRARLERERQAAVARSAACLERLRRFENALQARRARGKAAHMPKVAARPDAAGSTEEHTRWADGVDALLRGGESELASAENAERAAALGAHLQRLVASGPMATRFVAPVRPRAEAGGVAESASGTGAGDESPEHVAGEVARAVAGLPSGATPAERAAIELLAERAVTAGPGARSTLVTELKARIQAVGRLAAARAAQARRAEELLRSLDAIETAEVADLRTILERVIAGDAELLAVDEARVGTARARAIAEEDRQYARTELASALADLGYDVSALVDPAASTAVVSYAFLPGAPDHAVELRFEHGRYDYQLVRTTPSSEPERDASLEQALCKHMGQATAAAYERGVQWTLDHHRAPGAAATPYVAAAEQQRRVVRTTRLQQRQRDR